MIYGEGWKRENRKRWNKRYSTTLRLRIAEGNAARGKKGDTGESVKPNLPAIDALEYSAERLKTESNRDPGKGPRSLNQVVVKSSKKHGGMDKSVGVGIGAVGGGIEY